MVVGDAQLRDQIELRREERDIGLGVLIIFLVSAGITMGVALLIIINWAR